MCKIIWNTSCARHPWINITYEYVCMKHESCANSHLKMYARSRHVWICVWTFLTNLNVTCIYAFPAIWTRPCGSIYINSCEAHVQYLLSKNGCDVLLYSLRRKQFVIPEGSTNVALLSNRQPAVKHSECSDSFPFKRADMTALWALGLLQNSNWSALGSSAMPSSSRASQLCWKACHLGFAAVLFFCRNVMFAGASLEMGRQIANRPWQLCAGSHFWNHPVKI